MLIKIQNFYCSRHQCSKGHHYRICPQAEGHASLIKRPGLGRGRGVDLLAVGLCDSDVYSVTSILANIEQTHKFRREIPFFVRPRVTAKNGISIFMANNPYANDVHWSGKTH